MLGEKRALLFGPERAPRLYPTFFAAGTAYAKPKSWATAQTETRSR